jgi:LmbE family N-acetylglucosaminyl deacetylase
LYKAHVSFRGARPLRLTPPALSWRNGLAWSAVVFASWIVHASAAAQPPANAPQELAISRATRLMVVSPHPDDGALGGAGLIQRVLRLGGTVRVVQITSGDAFSTGIKAATHVARPTAGDYRRYGAQRERESEAAMTALGVPRADLLTLGFPDDGLCELAPERQVTAIAFESPYTKRASPPRSEWLLADVAYRGVDLERELRQILVSFRPTIVLLPDPHDEHPDHCTTHLWVHQALDDVRPSVAPLRLHYLVHFPHWPSPSDAGRRAVLAPPVKLASDNAPWRTLTLTERERATKARAIGRYASQVLAIGPFLHDFERSNELFLEGDPEGHVACWCRGEDVAPVRREAGRRTATAKQ